MRQKIIRPAPSEISYKDMRFLITDRPTDQTIANFIEVFIYFLLNYATIIVVFFYLFNSKILAFKKLAEIITHFSYFNSRN